MHIQIVKGKSLLVQDKYDIYINHAILYSAQKVFFSLSPIIKIYDLNNYEIGKVVKEYNEVKTDSPRYDIIFRNHSIVRLISEKKGLYKLYAEDDEFVLYENKNKIGIFTKGNQVGLLTCKSDPIKGKDVYEIIIDSAFVEIVSTIGFVLAFDNYYGKKDLGIGDNTHPFDENWKPQMRSTNKLY